MHSVSQTNYRLGLGDSAKTERVPDFIAVCVPLIFGTFRKPAEHPINAPPGKTG